MNHSKDHPTHPTHRRWRAGIVVAILAFVGSIETTDTKGEPMSYDQARTFLAKHTTLVELTNEEGARVAICPEWQGRVMTSSCDGLEGRSFGFINSQFIEDCKPDLRFNNFGGEDRMWLSPEGGQFSLWFKPGVTQNLDNWYTPPALNTGAWQIISNPGDPFYRMKRQMGFDNASGTTFALDVTRDVRLLNTKDLTEAFGELAATRMSDDNVKIVAYETINRITNRGTLMTKAKGLVSIWILGMMNGSPETIVIVPYKSGDESRLGPVVKSDYFGPIPPDRLKIIPEAILFRADSKFRSKIGTSQQRAKNVLGSIDFEGGVLTLVHFTMPEDPSQHDYMNNMWNLPQKVPYVGDVANSYNDGPPEPGKKGLGAFYEIESLSPAKALATNNTLTHHHRTVHIQADIATLTQLAKHVLGVELETVRREMLSPESHHPE